MNIAHATFIVQICNRLNKSIVWIGNKINILEKEKITS